jgi:hypothetical protein
MSNKGDWLPEKEAELVELFQRWDAALSSSAKRTEYGWEFADSDIRPNKKMTPADKLRYGIGPADTENTEGGEVEDTVDMSFKNDPHPDKHTQIVPYKKLGADNNSKDPYQMAVFQICIQGPGDPPPKVDDDAGWSRDMICMSSPFKYKFKSTDAGKICWYRARWEAKNGKQGDWAMFSAMTP